MPIANKFLREFDAISRAGGVEDFELGLSSLELIATQGAQFRVATFSVILSWSDPGKFGVRCSCAAFQKYPEPCHHVWTALLAFDTSTQPEVADARSLIESGTLALKKMGEICLQGAIDLKQIESWPYEKISPTGYLEFSKDKFTGFGFEYGLFRIAMSSPRKEFLDSARSLRIKRNQSAEKELLKSRGLKKLEGQSFSPVELRELISGFGGWHVLIDGKRVVTLEVDEAQLSEQDGHYDFTVRFSSGDQTFTLADLLSASSPSSPVESSGALATLKDGSLALIPDDWLKRIETISRGALLTPQGSLRFSRTSLPLFKPAFEDAVGLKIAPEAVAVFKTLSNLGQTGEVQPPLSLKASLRSYQCQGLFWLQKMSTAGFGGILADDMGLGKTVQIIAYLLSRRMYFRAQPGEQKPCLVVVPKSLVSNWINEVEKFGPTLRVLDFSGANRVIFRPQHFDLVLTTYHVMKNEIERLKLVDFDTIILDEAQAIKNPTSQISKAVFQLNGRQRFALSGTPIENSLRDLFSLMHFANPGLIPPSFDRIYGERKSLTLPKEVTAKIAASVRPFILRRTKKQVLKELPDKSEQILICEMDAPQKSLYDKTRRYFAAKLKETATPTTSVGPDGAINTSGGSGTARAHQTRVFEALLRLRQIACHPALVGSVVPTTSTNADTTTPIDSAKVEMLLEHLEDIQAAGNKALVFSQFTSFLDLLKPELERAGIPFEHLDGQTRNRGAVVDRFNSNPKTTVFLISLKAGGTGLNLTTASYVFLMDPWWNPAIESQAIDRAYRMGQKQKVMAYRLIAKGTIEEKILKLQDQKRDLASSLISEDAMGPALSLADLEYLLEE